MRGARGRALRSSEAGHPRVATRFRPGPAGVGTPSPPRRRVSDSIRPAEQRRPTWPCP
ncbi:hypothetical protein AAT19DRAFT_9313 [Rhodotorula toruloides]|uniref:Uncharacterized protein n=1 Tax=Rhodotorula toruloides TaxID=5286 RepID=A0A2T0A1U5_RHOTO|nr:hypothetical protein AAT19DRAFT_9313 [Rhodotorula toruloides]